jgi:TatA/E family protein of Tat protein translocase
VLNLDPGKLLVIAVVAILILGPDRLPQVARQIGGTWRSFNDFRQRMETEVRSNMPDLPSTSEIARLVRSPSALLDNLANIDSGDGPIEAPREDQQAATGGAPPGATGVATGAMSWVTADFPELEQMPSDPSVSEYPPTVRSQVSHAVPGMASKPKFDANLN